ncbi:Piwi domain-containing protein [Gaertneriomyces semiglobifer]|nr:Piwi domain-containing protein [Gaertneriomyces semiglobifer]
MTEPAQPPAVVQTPAFPKRPGYGIGGKKIRLLTNHWQALTMPARPIYQYDIDIQPATTMSINRRVFRQIVEENAKGTDAKFADRASKIVYDGRKIAFAPIKLDFGTEEAAVFSCDLPEDNGGTTAPGAKPGPAAEKPREATQKEGAEGGKQRRLFKMAVKLAATVDVERLKKFIKGEAAHGQVPQDAINAFDVLVRHTPTTLPECVPVGRGFYLPWLFSRSAADRNLTGGAEAWNGAKISMRPGEGVMLLNADLATSAFLQPGPLVEVCKSILGGRADFARPIPEGSLLVLDRALKTYTVHTTHRTTGRKRYRLARFSKTPASATMFESDVGGARRKISVAEYFDSAYGIKLKYPHLPCVECGPAGKRVIFPIEVCEIPPGQRLMRKLDERQTSAMIKVAQQVPRSRLNRTSEAVNAFIGPAREGTEYRESAYLSAFDVRLGVDPLTLDARLLPPPTISYSPKSAEKTVMPRDGAWNMRNKQVANGVTLGSWSVLVFENPARMPKQKVTDFVKMLTQTLKATGVNVTELNPPLRYARPEPAETIEDNLKAAYMDAGQGCKKKPQMILCILPDTNPRRYAEIKRVSDTVIGIITQCMQKKHCDRPNAQYCANLTLKINVKLGGFNSFLGRDAQNRPLLPFIADGPTLVLGVDITHPGPFEGEGRPSIAAMVGSLDAQCARFAATIRLQRAQGTARRSDIIQDVHGMVTELLRAFFQTSQVKPGRIVVFRDGASESQFNEIRQTEIKAIKRACSDIERASGGKGTYEPKITFVVVTKRHNVRFFPEKKEDADKSGNVLPGAVVDRTIVHPVEWDFFLQSHAGLQGTSRSSHYHILHDENSLTPDVIQNMTYRLCYLYARCTRSVSVCPPVYYADLVATRARFHFKGLEWSGESSAVSGGESEKGKVWDERWARVKEDLRKVMYFM